MIKNLPLNKTRNVVSLTLLASTTPKVSFRLSILVQGQLQILDLS